jgi:hypothetical protein
MNASPKQYPKLANCICRLSSNSDFKEFVEGLREFSKMADTHAVFGIGETGDAAKGVAQAYRAIIGMIDSASPSEENDLGSPRESLDSTNLE